MDTFAELRFDADLQPFDVRQLNTFDFQLQIHDSERPEPPKQPKAVYEDATPGLPDDFPRQPAKYGSRFHWLN